MNDQINTDELKKYNKRQFFLIASSLFGLFLVFNELFISASIRPLALIGGILLSIGASRLLILNIKIKKLRI